jgi:D-alanyl-D-alanine carboxypeptidase
MDRLVGALTAQGSIRQAVVSVETGDRRVSYHHVAGAAGADGESMTSDTPWFIASIDKLCLAVVVLKLSESGVLDLAARIAAYLPDSMTRGLHRWRGEDRSGEITVRHLLNHSSGLADWLEDAPPGGRSVLESLLVDGDAAFAWEDVARLVRERLRPHFPPQDPQAGRLRIRYSDTNYILLAAIVEAVLGKPLPSVFEEMLFRPLGMRDSFCAGDSCRASSRLAPAIIRAKGRPVHMPQLLSSIRGVFSTSGDLLRFMRAFVAGETFDRPATRHAMQQHWTPFGFPLDRAALRSPGWPIEYALGIMRFKLPRLLNRGRRMPEVIGHTGSTGCWLFYCEELDLYLAGNVGEVTAGALPYRLVPAILRAFAESCRG